MQSNMKKQIIFIGVLVVILLALTAVAIDKYMHSPKGVTLDQAVNQRDTALVNLQLAKDLDDTHQAAATKTIGDLRTANTTLTTTNTTLCAQIKSAKLVQPLCK